jgi:hypothetical protein
MGVGENFQTFCLNLVVSRRDGIASRCRAITLRLNKDFYGSDSEINHSFYGGSFGRDTAIDTSSDVDLVFVLPYSVYQQYNQYTVNGQSALLQAVRNSIKTRYTYTDIGADGQVIVVPFDDGITFEVLPAFLNVDGISYTHPNSNGGGKWGITKPKQEIDAIQEMDNLCNSNLKRLCKMTRAWKNEWTVPIAGLLIDTLAYNFIQDYEYRNKSYLYYDFMSRDFFSYLSNRDTSQTHWIAIGSGQYIWNFENFEFKAKQCYNLALEAIQQYSDGNFWSSNHTWRKIYGTKYPE